jgi:hypothetical protein
MLKPQLERVQEHPREPILGAHCRVQPWVAMFVVPHYWQANTAEVPPNLVPPTTPERQAEERGGDAWGGGVEANEQCRVQGEGAGWSEQ